MVAVLLKKLDDVGHPFVRETIKCIPVYPRRDCPFIGVNIGIRFQPQTVMVPHDFEEILYLFPFFGHLLNCFQSPTQCGVEHTASFLLGLWWQGKLSPFPLLPADALTGHPLSPPLPEAYTCG